ncbi:MAG: hypothetical protein CSB33_04765 [Desulfobacterales bacterium]|nr:MAG: hypothetical protein CSB33_04765 [Desulfobacterales bacterium]
MEWSFDGAGRLTLIADRNGNTQTLLYGANDRLHSVSDNFGRNLIFAYNINGRLQSLTTPIGSFTYVYANSNLTKVIHPDTKFRHPAFGFGWNGTLPAK